MQEPQSVIEFCVFLALPHCSDRFGFDLSKSQAARPYGPCHKLQPGDQKTLGPRSVCRLIIDFLNVADGN